MASIDLRKLAEQLDAAQSSLDQIRIISGCYGLRPSGGLPSKRQETLLDVAKRAYADRQIRTAFIGTKEIFGEPAWDMLLDLFIRQTENEQVTVNSMCLRGDLSSATVMRWLNVLERNRLVAVCLGSDGETPPLIRLTATGHEGMLQYLDSISYHRV